MITQETIDLAKAEDIKTLVALDEMGLIIAPNESSEAFAERLETLKNRLDDHKEQVQSKPFYEIEGMKFKSENVIPKNDFQPCLQLTEKLFRFSMNWVPGFYQNSQPSFLFGGCCYTSEPDFYSFFQVRQSFKTKPTWFFYHRDELMSHEMCHVARGGIVAKKYEEFFAYKTSKKKIRKAIGSILYSQIDTYLILALSLCMPAVQFYNINYSATNPISLLPFIGAFIALLCFYIIRGIRLNKNYKSALKNLEPIFGENSQAVLFRCNDQEIDQFAKTTPEEISTTLKKYSKETRWQIIIKRFALNQDIFDV
jgi:hypothetical protein